MAGGRTLPLDPNLPRERHRSRPGALYQGSGELIIARRNMVLSGGSAAHWAATGFTLTVDCWATRALQPAYSCHAAGRTNEPFTLTEYLVVQFLAGRPCRHADGW